MDPRQVEGVPGNGIRSFTFLMYINDLPNNIKSTVRLFANNCVMYTTI